MRQRKISIRSALLDVVAVAELLDCSTRQVYRLSDSGRMPRQIKLGGANRWRRDELLQWVADGCPRIQRGPAR